MSILIFIFVLSLHSELFCVLNVLKPTRPPASQFLLRSEIKPEMINDFEIWQTIKMLVIIIFLAILLWQHHSKFHPRFISFNICTNLLPKSFSYKSNYRNLILCFLILSYVMLFDLYLLVLLPSEIFEHKCFTRRKLDFVFIIIRRSQTCSIDVLSSSFILLSRIYRVTSICHNPHEKLVLWYLLLHLIFSSDVHPNPGPVPVSNNFSGGFFFFVIGILIR